MALDYSAAYTILSAGVSSVHLKPREITQFVTQLAEKPLPLKKHHLAITKKNIKPQKQTDRDNKMNVSTEEARTGERKNRADTDSERDKTN